MSKKEKDWNKVEQNYLQMKEQELEQVNLPELWSRIEEKLDQSRSEERTEKEIKMKKEKKRKRKGRQVAVFGTLGAAAVLAIVSWAGMDQGNSLRSESTALVDFCDSSESGADQSSQMNEAQESTNKEIASEKEKATATLLSVEKENGYYELSMDVEISDLQLMETSVDNKAELSLVAYSEFSDSAREVLQEKISDISSYAFYINLEGILYIEREGHYYQMVVSVRR